MKNFLIALNFGLVLLCACSDEPEPITTNEGELIDFVQLIFSPLDGGAPLTFEATDPDGDGQANLTTDGPIVLSPETEYQLFIRLENTINGEDIGEEVDEEGEDHQFFFSFSDMVFSSPEGNGNIDSGGDLINYDDFDQQGNPIGLISKWTTSGASQGQFRVMLKHQPDGIKSSLSDATVGTTDIDITWDLKIEQ